MIYIYKYKYFTVLLHIYSFKNDITLCILEKQYFVLILIYISNQNGSNYIFKFILYHEKYIL